MSRFPPDRLHLGIEADRLTLVRLRGIFRPIVMDSQTRDLPAPEKFSALAEVLGDELRTSRWQGTRVRAVLSDRLVRYFIALRPSGARSAKELRQAALAQFEEIYGDDNHEWQVERDLSPFAQSDLVCACRKSMTTTLLDLLLAHRLPLASLVPRSVAEFNRHRRRIGSSPAWLAVIGRAHLSLSYRDGDNFLASSVHAMHEDAADALPEIVEQERLRLTLMNRKVDPAAPVFCTGQFGDERERDRLAAQQFDFLDAPLWLGQDEAWAQTYRLALSEEWPACA